MGKQFLNYINWFRGIAILCVVFGHSVPLASWQNKWIQSAVEVFFTGGTILFVFISGYLFEHLKSRFELKKYFISKIKNVLAPYMLVSIPAIAIYILKIKTDHRWILTPEFERLPDVFKVLKFYITGAHLGPLWFIPMITLMFLISPILLRTISNKYLQIVVFVLSGILFVVYPRPLLNENVFQAFLHFLFVYYLGMLFSCHKVTLNTLLEQKRAKIILGVCFVATFVLAVVTKDRNLFFLQKFFFMIFTIAVLLNYEKKRSFRFLDSLAQYSFGIYFIHGYIIAVIAMLGKNVNGIALYIVLAGGITIISWGVVFVVKKILGTKSRYVIGC